MTNQKTGAQASAIEPRGREISNIRTRPDGTYVVSINGATGLIADYHACPPDVDPFAPVGLWDEVVAAAKKSRKKLAADAPVVVEAPPLDQQEALADEKVEAERVIKLLQMSFDVGDATAEAPLREWKVYRLALERTGLQADMPTKPDWIG